MVYVVKVSPQPCLPFLLEAATFCSFFIFFGRVVFSHKQMYIPTFLLYLTPVAVLFLSREAGRWRGFCFGGSASGRGESGAMAYLHGSCFPPPRSGVGDRWLFPPGRAGGICPTDAHPHPDPRVSSQPAHGLQSTLQPEPKTVSTCIWGPG